MVGSISSSIDKAIDGDFKAHLETGTPNRVDFKNKVIYDIIILNWFKLEFR